MMHAKVQGIAEYFVREALRGYYNQKDVNHGDHDTATLRAYHILMTSIRGQVKSEKYLAEEITRAILMAYWGRVLSPLDIRGERFKRACHDVYKALQDSIQKTMKDEH